MSSLTLDSADWGKRERWRGDWRKQRIELLRWRNEQDEVGGSCGTYGVEEK